MEPPTSSTGLKHVAQTSPYLELENPFTILEGVKLVLLFPLFIIRLFVVVMLFLPLALVSFVASLGADLSRPFPRWRRAMVHVLRPITKLVAMCMGFSVHLTGWENYQQALQKNLKLVVFNHSSWADSAIMLYLFAPSGVSRAANSRIPVVGTIINSFQNIYVQSGERSAQSSDSSGLSSPLAPQSTTSLIGERLAQDGWPLTAIAPEGMTHNGKQVLKFKSGAFVLGMPVLPVCISYERKPLNPAWTIQNEPWHVLRLMTQLWTTAYVDILPMHEPSDAEKQDAQLYAENVRSMMAQKMGVPTSPLGIPEYHQALKMGVTVDWRGRLVAPEGSLDSEGCIVAAGEARTSAVPSSRAPSIGSAAGARALAEVENMVASSWQSVMAPAVPNNVMGSPHLNAPSGSRQVQVQTGEIRPLKKTPCDPFSQAMDSCALITTHLQDFRRVQKGIKDIEPLVEELKAEKCKAEQERDVQQAKALAMEKQVVALTTRNEELSAEIVMLEDDMGDMLEAEKVHIEHAQQAQLIAEKALQDSMNVNTMLQKQVSELQYANRELHKHIARSTAGNTSNTTQDCTQTLPEPVKAPQQHEGTSTSRHSQFPDAVTEGASGKKLQETSEGGNSCRTVKVRRRQDSNTSTKDDVLAGVKSLQAELMRSVVQQMDALANQHICLQVGQVLLSDSPVPAPSACASPAASSTPSKRFSSNPTQWSPNPIFDTIAPLGPLAARPSPYAPTNLLHLPPPGTWEIAPVGRSITLTSRDAACIPIKPTQSLINVGSLADGFPTITESPSSLEYCSNGTLKETSRDVSFPTLGSLNSPELTPPQVTATTELVCSPEGHCSVHIHDFRLTSPVTNPLFVKNVDEQRFSSPMGSWAYTLQSFSTFATPKTSFSASPVRHGSPISSFQHRLLSPEGCVSVSPCKMQSKFTHVGKFALAIQNEAAPDASASSGDAGSEHDIPAAAELQPQMNSTQQCMLHGSPGAVEACPSKEVPSFTMPRSTCVPKHSPISEHRQERSDTSTSRAVMLGSASSPLQSATPSSPQSTCFSTVADACFTCTSLTSPESAPPRASEVATGGKYRWRDLHHEETNSTHSSELFYDSDVSASPYEADSERSTDDAQQHLQASAPAETSVEVKLSQQLERQAVIAELEELRARVCNNKAASLQHRLFNTNLFQTIIPKGESGEEVFELSPRADCLHEQHAIDAEEEFSFDDSSASEDVAILKELSRIQEGSEEVCEETSASTSQVDVDSKYCGQHAISHASLPVVQYPSASEVEQESDFEPADFSEDSSCADTEDEQTEQSDVDTLGSEEIADDSSAPEQRSTFVQPRAPLQRKTACKIVRFSSIEGANEADENLIKAGY